MHACSRAVIMINSVNPVLSDLAEDWFVDVSVDDPPSPKSLPRATVRGGSG
jgi:hypothetical protein